MRINKAILAVLLYCAIVLGMVLNVSADDTNNLKVVEVSSTEPCVRVKLQNIDVSKTVKKVRFAVWSKEDGKDDIVWYTASLKNDEYRANVKLNKHENTGVYYVYCYATYEDNSRELLSKTTFNVKKPTAEKIEINSIDINKAAINASIEGVKNRTGAEIVYIGFSHNSNPDDIIWYEADRDGKSTYKVSVNISDFSNKTGVYNVYGKILDLDGEYYTLDSITCDVNLAPTAEVFVDYVDKVNGKMFVKITDIYAPSGIKRVRVPIWSKADQSDIKWYDAEKNSDGTYSVLADIDNHSNNWGKYKIYTQITLNNGVKAYANKTSFNLTKSSKDKIVSKEFEAVALDIEDTSDVGVYNISMNKPALDEEIAYVEYAVWSKYDGQDDILWFISYENSSGAFNVTIDTKLLENYGKYSIKAYAVLADGSRVVVKESSFRLNKPSIEKLKISNVNRSKGTFNVVLSGVENTLLASKFQIGVKSSGKNAKTVWYDVIKSGNGVYYAKVDIKNHEYDTGEYSIKARLVDFRGKKYTLLNTTYSFDTTYQYIKTKDSKGTENKIGVLLYKLDVPGGFKKVKFAVWSKTNGQDDLKWYDAQYENGFYYYYIPIANHKTLGSYYVHVYYITPDGEYQFLTEKTFSINSKASGNVKLNNVDGMKGRFKVTISDISALSGVSKVNVTVWSKSNKSDKKTYTAKKQSDGKYSLYVYVSDHNDNFGTYNVSTSITMKNGITNNIGTKKVTIEPLNYIKVKKINEGKVKITILNPGDGKASKVKFPTWSSKNGQDDIKWYVATNNGDGSWSATIKTNNHKDVGKYITHVYVEYKGKSTYVGQTDYKLKGLNYSQKLSTFSTVSQNNENGTYNMTKALLKFNGLTVQPGETVSFFDVAGPCGKNQGFKIAGTVQGSGYGGGICQASTTLYGGALRAGMTIVERRSHSARSVYVPVGQDAMVSYGSSDFKFRNDHNYPVKIVTYVVDKTLYVEFWGIQESWYDDIEINSWSTGSNTAAAERIYYLDGEIVKRERLTNSYYPKG